MESGFLSDFGKLTSFILEKPAALPRSNDPWLLAGPFEGSPEFVQVIRKDHLVVRARHHVIGDEFSLVISRIEEINGISVGRKEGVQIAVPIIVGESDHDSRPFKVEAELGSLVAEDALTVVDVKLGGAIETANGKIKVTIVVDVGEGGSGWPLAIGLFQSC